MGFENAFEFLFAGDLSDELSHDAAQFADVFFSELFEFLKDWLTGHIIAVDKRYKPFVETVELTPSDLAGTFGDAESEGEDGTTIGAIA